MRCTGMERFFIHWRRLALMLILVGFLAVDASGVRAGSVDALSKQAMDLMRQAESKMHKGENEAAGKLLAEAGELIDEIVSKRPDHPDLSDLKKSGERLTESLRKKQSPITLFNMMAVEAKKNKPPDSTMGKNDLNSLFRTSTDKSTSANPADILKRDVEALEIEYVRLEVLFDSAAGVAIDAADLEPVKVLITRMESFENADLPRLETKLSDFSRKYGASREEIEKRAGSAGYTGSVGVGLHYEKLKEGISNVAKTRPVMAESLVKNAEKRLNATRKGHEFLRADGYMDILSYIELARRFDLDNQEVEDSCATMGRTIDKEIMALSDQIDKRVWPGHAADAPENAETLASIALSWFKNSPEWGRREETPGLEDNESRIPVAVAISGPWSIEKKDALGKTVIYGLPVLLAVQLESETPMDVTRVYGVALRTRASPDAKTRPAFDAAVVGPSCYFRPHGIQGQ